MLDEDVEEIRTQTTVSMPVLDIQIRLLFAKAINGDFLLWNACWHCLAWHRPVWYLNFYMLLFHQHASP